MGNIITSYKVAEAHRPYPPLATARTERPPAEPLWAAVTSFGVHFADLEADERAEIQAQHPNVMLRVLAAVQWRRRT